MKKDAYFQVSGIIFAAFAVLHALRLVFGWEVVIGGWEIPTIASVGVILVAGALSYTAIQLKK